MPTPDLSVIIVNYNVRQFLENALTSIRRALEGLHGEIFVVDNASTDGSVEMVRAGFPDVTVIANSENLGFAKANNLALTRARGKFILLINPDTIVQEDTLRVMMKFFEAHPGAGLAGCKILNPDGSFQLPCRRSFPTPWVALAKIAGLSSLFPRSRLFGKYNLTYLSVDETYEVDAVSGSFMMLTREAYEKIGGLDETFFMYGEDLDWCYRVRQSGLQVYYVHSTTIIHYKGESTKRSNIDEIRHFYGAMEVFVEKHFSGSSFVVSVLSLGIAVRRAIAFIIRFAGVVANTVVDFLAVDLAILLAGYAHFGFFVHYPDYAQTIVWSVPAFMTVAVLASLGVYGRSRGSLFRPMIGTIISFIGISAIVFFAKGFAFSRAVTLIAGVISALLIPLWRFAARCFGRGRSGSRMNLFGRRTVIVGTGTPALEILRKLRARVENRYEVLGFIDITMKRVGEKIAGVEVLGSIENVGKVVDEYRVSDVIFSTDGLSYADILSVIARSGSRSVNFLLVASSLEAIIGKTSIDRLDTLPLVEIDYNIHKTLHRGVKRGFDILLSGILLIFVYPFVRLLYQPVSSQPPAGMAGLFLLLPQVFSGKLSFVGRPLNDSAVRDAQTYLGPRGLTGLAQLNEREDLGEDEKERYTLYYAKNQSLALDLEILLKSLLGR